jgi:hypothetical protein
MCGRGASNLRIMCGTDARAAPRSGTTRRQAVARRSPAQRAHEVPSHHAADDCGLLDALRERNADKTAEKALADATAAVEAVRRARRRRSRTAAPERRGG